MGVYWDGSLVCLPYHTLQQMRVRLHQHHRVDIDLLAEKFSPSGQRCITTNCSNEAGKTTVQWLYCNGQIMATRLLQGSKLSRSVHLATTNKGHSLPDARVVAVVEPVILEGLAQDMPGMVRKAEPQKPKNFRVLKMAG